MGKIYKAGKNYHNISIKNLYEYFLQRNINDNEYQYYGSGYGDALNAILTSEEFKNLSNIKETNIVNSQEFNQKIDYTIVKVDDRGVESIKHNAEIMGNNFIYHDGLTFFNYKKQNLDEFLSYRGMRINNLNERFGIYFPQTNGNHALIASDIIAMEYMLKNNIPEMIIFEDDIILHKDFTKRFKLAYNDLPKDYDFLADMTVLPNYEEFATEEKNNLIGSDYICKSYLQNSHTGFMLWSNKGAKKMLDAWYNFGILCPIDTFMFYLGQTDILNGFTTFQQNKFIDQKDIYGSLLG